MPNVNLQLIVTPRDLDLIIFALSERAAAIARAGGNGAEELRNENLRLCRNLEAMRDYPTEEHHVQLSHA